MKYKTLVASNAEELDEKVNEALRQGWTLQGGVSVSSHGYTYDGRDGQTTQEEWTWAQAVVRTLNADLMPWEG